MKSKIQIGILLAAFFGSVAVGSADVKQGSRKAQTAIPKGCNILKSSGWTSSVNAFPPAKPRLGVKGVVVTKSGGFRVDLVRKAIDLNPRIVTLELVATPPSGVGSAVLTTHRLDKTFPDLSSRHLDKVIVKCGSDTLTEISPVPTVE